jgi:hypothetical protein
MYKPVYEDIEVNNEMIESLEDPSKEIVQLCIYLIGDGLNHHFGRYQNIPVPKDATVEQRREAVEKGAQALLSNFDVQAAAKKNGYDGNLNELKPLSLVGMHKITEEK